MSRWIDADALIAELQKDEKRFDKEADDCRKNSRNYTDCYMQAMSSRADGIRDAIIEVYDAPSIDIVRCKECKHWNSETNGCKRNPSVEAWKADDFCSYGERVEQTEPQVIMPKKCKSCDSASKIIEAYSRGWTDGAEAVKQMQTEPQTDCAWK